MKVVTLKAHLRESLGSSESRRARREGRLPVVVYSNGDDAAHITVDMRTFRHALDQGARVIDLDEKGTTSRVLLKDVQFDALGLKLMHADFLRLSSDKEIELAVQLDLQGTPKGVLAGGTLTTLSGSVTLRCLPGNIPEAIEVDVSGLELGDILKAADVALPERTVLVTSLDAVLLTVAVPRGLKEDEEDEEESAEGEGAAAAEGDAN
jgi:large subunit ribosomal protein L25